MCLCILNQSGDIVLHINIPPEPQYQRSIHTMLNQATSDTRQIINVAKRLLKEIYKTGYRYQKCSVQLGNIQLASQPRQIDLFDIPTSNGYELMSTVDQINQNFPKGIAVSTAGIKQNWQFQVERLSGHYTTQWNELAVVKCQ